MTAIWEHRFADLVKRIAARRESTSLELIPDLLPVLPVLDGSANTELCLLRGERLFCSSQFNVGAAAQFNTHRLRNPAGSNVLIVVRQVAVSPQTSTSLIDMHLTFVDTDLGTPEFEGTADGRLLGPAGPPTHVRGVCSSQSIAASPALAHTVYLGFHTGNVTQIVQPFTVIPPGCSFDVHNRTPNVGMASAIIWTERVCDPAELTAV